MSISSSRGFFPLKQLKEIWAEVEPRQYPYTITAAALVQAMMTALVFRLPGLRAISQVCSAQLKSTNFSSLSPALARASSLRFVQRLVELLTVRRAPRKNELIAIDSMAVTIPKTRRHHCPKINRHTVGGGVLWSFRIFAPRGESPIEVHRLIEGAWHDSKLAAAIEFLARGPIYLMDSGFYALLVLDRLVRESIRFVMRARQNELVYETLRTISHPRMIGKLRLLEDAKVRLGGARAKLHPVVRLVRAQLPSGETLILVSNLYRCGADKILAHYKQRHKIERFHRLIKETIGLAHLYSFHQRGMQFLLHVALLLALLLYLGQAKINDEVIHILHQAIRQLRQELNIVATWKRNMATRQRTKKKKKVQNL